MWETALVLAGPRFGKNLGGILNLTLEYVSLVTNHEPPVSESNYPVTEAFIEFATKEEVESLFNSVKEALRTLKGPRAEQGKKVSAALSQTEALLLHLIQVREKLEEDNKSAAGGRK
jgi:hypothetical protein